MYELTDEEDIALWEAIRLLQRMNEPELADNLDQLPSLTAWGYSGDKEEREALQLRVHEHVMKQPKDQVGVHW